MSYLDFNILEVDEHFEVFDNYGRFCFSADTYEEAIKEIENWT